MQKLLPLRETKIFILFIVLVIFLAGFIFSCSLFPAKGTDKFSVSDKSRFADAFKKFQIIGEGSDFLTVKCDINRLLSDKFSLHALVLDRDNQPLRKVSGYTYNPRLKGKNHLWFYFFLYDPGKAFHSSAKSHYIKFIVTSEDKIVMEHVVKNIKTWGSKDKAKIFDLPAAPDQIFGHLILKDYTFLAKGDIRKPRGYCVAGKLIGHQGRWTHFMVTSDIIGQDDLLLEYILPVDEGWLELATGSTHSMKEAVSPAEPYINGWWDGKGYFHPRPLKIEGLKKR